MERMRDWQIFRFCASPQVRNWDFQNQSLQVLQAHKAWGFWKMFCLCTYTLEHIAVRVQRLASCTEDGGEGGLLRLLRRGMGVVP